MQYPSITLTNYLTSTLSSPVARNRKSSDCTGQSSYVFIEQIIIENKII